MRRRLLDQACRELVGEFDKHAGRARWDLTKRFDALRRRFELAMAAELDRAIEAIETAARHDTPTPYAKPARPTGDGGKVTAVARAAASRAVAAAGPPGARGVGSIRR